MIRLVLGVSITTLLLVQGAVLAQENGTNAVYAYVTYFECDAGREYRADEIIERSFKPHYDAAVKSGEILQWSWLSHFIGGKWRRALVITTGSMDNLLASAGALGEAIEESTPEAGRVFTEICPVHEDYIWETVPGVAASTPGQDRGQAGFSVYMDCDVNREARVDQIMGETIGPLYKAQMAAGNLVSWSWLSHNVGGKWRRLLSLTATDHNTLMHARAAVIDELSSGRAQRAFNQVNEICPDHQDYMWDVRFETP